MLVSDGFPALAGVTESISCLGSVDGRISVELTDNLSDIRGPFLYPPSLKENIDVSQNANTLASVAEFASKSTHRQDEQWSACADRE